MEEIPWWNQARTYRVTVTMMSISGTVPDIRLKTQDIVVQYANAERIKPLGISPKMAFFRSKTAFSSRYENLVFIPAATCCHLMKNDGISILLYGAVWNKPMGFDDVIIRNFQIWSWR